MVAINVFLLRACIVLTCGGGVDLIHGPVFEGREVLRDLVRLMISTELCYFRLLNHNLGIR
jgi:hypothetical protein